jgi:hypothetical protein
LANLQEMAHDEHDEEARSRVSLKALELQFKR